MSNKLIEEYGTGRYLHPPWDAKVYNPLSDAFNEITRQKAWRGVVPRAERDIANMVKAELGMQANETED